MTEAPQYHVTRHRMHVQRPQSPHFDLLYYRGQNVGEAGGGGRGWGGVRCIRLIFFSIFPPCQSRLKQGKMMEKEKLARTTTDLSNENDNGAAT